MFLTKINDESLENNLYHSGVNYIKKVGEKKMEARYWERKGNFDREGKMIREQTQKVNLRAIWGKKKKKTK